MSPTTARKKVIATVLFAYALVLIHALAVQAAGGLKKVPLIVFGLCQFTPWIAAWWMMRDEGGLWTRAKVLLKTKAWGMTALSAGCAAFVLLGATAVAWSQGDTVVSYGAEVTALYPFKHLVPSIVLNPKVFVLFLMFVAPVLHGLNAFGEEILWRGVLLDKMAIGWDRSTARILNGVFWGLWHAPTVVLLGWDFPGHVWMGVVAITLSQVAWSVFMAEVRLRTDSLWPALAMHAVANALTIGLFDRMVNHDFNILYSPWGLWGAAAMSLISLIWIKTTRSGEPLQANQGQVSCI